VTFKLVEGEPNPIAYLVRPTEYTGVVTWCGRYGGGIQTNVGKASFDMRDIAEGSPHYLTLDTPVRKLAVSCSPDEI
jgi:hypothetical protein